MQSGKLTKLVLRQRRAQIDLEKNAAELTGPGAYLARNGHAERLQASPTWFRPKWWAQTIQKSLRVFDVTMICCSMSTLSYLLSCRRPPSNAQKSDTPFKDVRRYRKLFARQGLGANDCRGVQAQSAWGCSSPETNGNQNSEMRVETNTR